MLKTTTLLKTDVQKFTIALLTTVDPTEFEILCSKLKETNFITFVIVAIQSDSSSETTNTLCGWTQSLDYAQALTVLLSSDVFIYRVTVDLLIDVSSAFLILARRIQERYCFFYHHPLHTNPSDTLSNYCSLYRRALSQLCDFCCKFVNNGVVELALNSPWFLQIYVNDSDKLSLVMMQEVLLRLIMELGALVFTQHLNPKRLITILDEVAYNICNEEVSDELFAISVKWLSKLANSSKEVCKTYNSRYHGLVVFLLRRLTVYTSNETAYRPSETLLSDIASILRQRNDDNSSNLQLDASVEATVVPNMTQSDFIQSPYNFKSPVLEAKREPLSRNEAAVRLQSAWRGYSLRKRLKRAKSSISAFQKTFRDRKRKEQTELDSKRLEADLRHQLDSSRRRNRRERDEAELELIKLLPSPLVGQWLAQQRISAAIRIQTAFRGWQVRRRLSASSKTLREQKAATTIQRWYRGKISCRYCASLFDDGTSTLLKQPMKKPMSDEERKEYLQVTLDYRSWREGNKMPLEELDVLHKQLQIQLRRNTLRRLEEVKLSNIRKSRIDEINADAELMCSQLTSPATNEMTTALAQSLADEAVSTRLVDRLRTQSRPIAGLARLQHWQQMRDLDRPWWRRWQMAWRHHLTHSDAPLHYDFDCNLGIDNEDELNLFEVQPLSPSSIYLNT